MAITSKVDICNMALGHLGNYGTVTNIDTPTNDKETTFKLWYDITRQVTLKTTMPNFSLARRLVGELVTTVVFGYANAFEYPNDCLKVLGLGPVDERAENLYAVESDDDEKVIYTDDDWDDGMELRFIRDVTNVNTMSPEFKMLLSLALAANVALPITQDANKKAAIEKMLPGKMSELSGLNAQENRPIRISNSRFRAARYADISRNPQKK